MKPCTSTGWANSIRIPFRSYMLYMLWQWILLCFYVQILKKRARQLGVSSNHICCGWAAFGRLSSGGKQNNAQEWWKWSAMQKIKKRARVSVKLLSCIWVNSISWSKTIYTSCNWFYINCTQIRLSRRHIVSNPVRIHQLQLILYQLHANPTLKTPYCIQPCPYTPAATDFISTARKSDSQDTILYPTPVSIHQFATDFISTARKSDSQDAILYPTPSIYTSCNWFYNHTHIGTGVYGSWLQYSILRVGFACGWYKISCSWCIRTGLDTIWRLESWICVQLI